ncbi:zinc ribbon domain-containing protein [Sodalis sp.]|uniref:zinc ribbon domain-containing protein n=1 Tax=Sodalis sp. (in: enterobacteria) TaxID=1898979 RepID=UPI0038731955
MPTRAGGAGLHCPACGQDYREQARCPDCGQPLEILKACGAVDYFCPHGDGLIAKKRVTLSLVPR